MAKSKKLQHKSDAQHHEVSLHKLSSRCTKDCGGARQKKRWVKKSENKEWKDELCSVCLEFPHNAVLLLCSSYDKGCRPYMCSTSHRYSNCLEQYTNAYTKVVSNHNTQPMRGSADHIGIPVPSGCSDEKCEISELLCPLCRGQVKGWTVIEPARRHLNAKKRACMQDKCSFVGTFKELRKHVKLEHPLARPRAIDPLHAKKWKTLENDRDLNDVFSTIRSTMPGAVVVGDYVVERNFRGGDGHLNDAIFRFPTRVHWNGPMFSHDDFLGVFDHPLDDEDWLE